MRKPSEHGNTVSSLILGISSIVLAILIYRNFLAILYWVPIWMGLFLYDVPFRKIFRTKEDSLMFLSILILSGIAVFTNWTLIVPYAAFFVIYVLRIYLASKRAGFVGTAFGILAYVILFADVSGVKGHYWILLTISLFLFMIGSEFTVRAKLVRNNWLLTYDLLPSFLFILDPLFAVFSVSVLRIPVAMKAKGLRSIGITETSLLLIVVMLLSLFYVLKL